MRRVVTSSGRQISDFRGVSLILAPPRRARVSLRTGPYTPPMVSPRPSGVDMGANGRRDTTGDAGRGCNPQFHRDFCGTGAAICRTPSTAGRAATPGAGGLLRCLVRPRSPVRAEADAERPRRHL